MGVNIDSPGQQQAEEALNSRPHPNIYANQQQQVRKIQFCSALLTLLMINLCLIRATAALQCFVCCKCQIQLRQSYARQPLFTCASMT